MRLWQHGWLLNNYAPGDELMGADADTLFLENQKNGNKGATIHHTVVAAGSAARQSKLPFPSKPRRISAVTVWEIAGEIGL
jgi:hypothetical protein